MAILLPMCLRARSSNSNQAKKRYSPERQLTRLASTIAPTTRPRPAKERVGEEAPTIQVANIQEAPMAPPNRTNVRSCRILAASAEAPDMDVIPPWAYDERLASILRASGTEFSRLRHDMALGEQPDRVSRLFQLIHHRM